MTITMTDAIGVLPDRILVNLRPDGEHWLWAGWANDQGYPYSSLDGRDQPAYRVVWTILVGPIADGLELDHLCVTPMCVRPLHLEPVTHAENQRRIALRQTACRRVGHDWTIARNVRTRPNGRRYCAECDRINLRARRAAKRAAA